MQFADTKDIICYATLAQLVEQRFCKPWVVSSNLTGGSARVVDCLSTNQALSVCAADSSRAQPAWLRPHTYEVA